MPKATQPTNDKQIQFLDMVIDGATIPQASEACGYARAYGYVIANKYKDYIVDRAKGVFYLNALKAAEKVAGTMDEKGENPAAKLNMEAALQVLDRAGITKQENLNLTVDTQSGIFILPAKDIVKKLSDDESED